MNVVRFLALPILFSATSLAANIEWNCFTATPYDDGLEGTKSHELFYASGQAQLGTDLIIGVVRNKQATTLTGQGGWLLSGTDWISATVGEIVDAQTFSSLKTYFYKDDGLAKEAPIVAKATGEDVYLAFQTWLWEEDYSSVEREVYGWVQLYVQGESISVVASAIDLDGGPMIVGGGSATPEPSCALLLLIGVGVLGLRRRPAA